MLKNILYKISQPLTIALLCGLAFGLQVFWLGYYIDDWIILNAFNTGGLERLRMYSFLDNRPLVFWIWYVGFLVNGVTPYLWQIWALLWRILTVISFWVVLREIWPQHRRQVLLASLLFAVYPIFYQQATALTYSFHWICFTLYFVSLYFTVLSVKRPGKYALYTFLAILTGGIQLFSQEFFVGLELFRPVVMFYVVPGSFQNVWGRVRKAVLAWLPYLLMIAAYGYWRFVIQPATSGGDRNSIKILTDLRSSPLSTLVDLAQTALQDIVTGLLGAWYKVIQPDSLTITPGASLVAWAVVGITFVSLLLVLPRIFKGSEEVEASFTKSWHLPAILLGLALLVFGFAPGWMIGRQYADFSGLYNDRFGLPAMPGAALVVAGGIEWLVRSQKARLGVFAALIALSAGSQFRAETVYRYSWEKQLRFFWELSWRAPQLKPSTAIFAEGTLFTYMGGFANKSAINQVYMFNRYAANTPYWYFDIYKTDPAPFVSGAQPIQESRGTMVYSGGQTDNLVIQFHPADGQCLWVLDAGDKNNNYITAGLKAILPLSNPDRIQEADSVLPSSLYGPQPAPYWCYYYEKGALAAQFSQWDQALSLWKQAQGKGFHPQVGIEYFPFIQAAAMTGDWQQAQDLAMKADSPENQMAPAMCATWQKIFQQAPPSGGKDAAMTFAKVHQGCQVTN